MRCNYLLRNYSHNILLEISQVKELDKKQIFHPYNKRLLLVEMVVHQINFPKKNLSGHLEKK